MSLKKFLFFIMDGDLYRQIQNDNVVSLSTPWALPEAPDGSQEISIGWERSQADGGTVRSFSLPLGGVLSMGRILRDDYYRNNIDVSRHLVIARLTYESDATTFKEYYKKFYKGELDFSTFLDDQGNYKTSINLMEGNLQKLIKAGENTKFDIALDGDAANLFLDGVFLKANYRWLLPVESYLSGGERTIATFQLNNEQTASGFAPFDVAYQDEGTITQDSLNYFGEFAQSITGVHFKGTVIPFLGAEFETEIRLLVLKKNNPTPILYYVFNGHGNNDYQPINFDIVFDADEGDKLFFSFLALVVLAYIPFLESEVSITFNSRVAPSNIRAFTLYDAGRILCNRMGIDSSKFYAPSLLNQPKTTLLTSGDGVRGLLNSGIKTSWIEYKKFIYVHYGLGVQITDSLIRIEPYLDYFKPESISNPAIDLGDIKKFKNSPALDFFFTSIKVGDGEPQVDDTNGKLDPNSFQIYSTPVKRIAAKELDLQTSYKTSPYEITQTQANFEGKTTTDKQSDNDVFALAAKAEAATILTGTAQFKNDGSPVYPGQKIIIIDVINPLLYIGQTIKITSPSGVNDQVTQVSSATILGTQQYIEVLDAVITDEGPQSGVTLEVTNGKNWVLDRDLPVIKLTDPDQDDQIKSSLFNVPLTPKRALVTHLPELGGFLQRYGTGVLKFESENRNKELISGDNLVEKADILVSDLPAPAWQAEFFEFETLVPANIVEILEKNLTPIFAFRWKGVRYTGFLWHAGFAPNTKEEQTFKLLACAGQDLKTLIS